MLTLRVLQGTLVAFGVLGIWFALRRIDDATRTVQVIAAATAAAMALVCTQILPLAWLATGGTIGMATVTKIDCVAGQKHHVGFEFEAGASKIAGLESDSYGERSCSALQIGDKGAVTYIANHPEVHVWGSLHSQLNEILAALLFAAIVVPFVVHVSIKRRRREV